MSAHRRRQWLHRGNSIQQGTQCMWWLVHQKKSRARTPWPHLLQANIHNGASSHEVVQQVMTNGVQRES